jgi:hypothetical protein
MKSTITIPQAAAQQRLKAVGMALLSASLLIFALPAHADSLVTNGSFESLTNGTGQISNGTGSAGLGNTAATGWTTSGYNFVFGPGTADTSGTYVKQYSQYLTLWGTNNSGLDVIPASSPDGGNFLAADGDYEDGAISQTINGLTVGDKYQVGFWWAASQQHGFNGATEQYWAVSLGAQTLDTPTYDLSSHAFSGWMYQTDTFTATSSSEVLSFLAVGNVPVPPFALLDGVTMNDESQPSSTPEPASLLLLFTGMAGGLAVLGSKKLLRI